MAIRKLREARNFTQEGFADHIRMHRAYYGALENGKKNLQLSTERATSVMDLLRKQCGVHNVIQTVPMGSPLLFDPKNPGENRVAEIWTLVP